MYSLAHEARPVEQDVGKAIDQVPPLFLRLLRRVLVGDVPAPPLKTLVGCSLRILFESFPW